MEGDERRKRTRDRKEPKVYKGDDCRTKGEKRFLPKNKADEENWMRREQHTAFSAVFALSAYAQNRCADRSTSSGGRLYKCYTHLDDSFGDDL